MKDRFIPAFYPIQNYAGGFLTALERQWFKDMSSIRVGPAQLRLVRMKESEFKQSRDMYVKRYVVKKQVFFNERIT